MVAGPILAALLSLVVSSTGLQLDVSDTAFCSKDGRQDEKLCVPKENFRLTRLNGVKVNHSWSVTAHDNRPLTLRTLHMQPQILEIPNFLTEAECKHLMKLGKRAGLQASTVYNIQQREEQATVFDVDDDGTLTLEEMKLTLELTFDAYLEKEDIFRLYKRLDLDGDKDGKITRGELQGLSPESFTAVLSQLTKDRPETLPRNSKTAWLDMTNNPDATFRSIQKRFAKVTNLPLDLIRLGECQVVKYTAMGHFNGHWDCSLPLTRQKLPCCNADLHKHCKVCRYLTGLIYLNDVKKGGETAFPMMESLSLNTTANLYRDCHRVELKISPRRGTMLLWYNFLLDDQTGWKGDLDLMTFHGGCRVEAGEKWLANFWVRVEETKEDTLRLMGKLRQ